MFESGLVEGSPCRYLPCKHQFFRANEKVGATSGSGPYAPQAKAVAKSLTSESTERRSSPPQLIADTVAKALTASRPKTRYAVGYGARPMIFLHDVLPDRWFDAFMRRATGVPSPSAR